MPYTPAAEHLISNVHLFNLVYFLFLYLYTESGCFEDLIFILLLDVIKPDPDKIT